MISYIDSSFFAQFIAECADYLTSCVRIMYLPKYIGHLDIGSLQTMLTSKEGLNNYNILGTKLYVKYSGNNKEALSDVINSCRLFAIQQNATDIYNNIFASYIDNELWDNISRHHRVFSGRILSKKMQFHKDVLYLFENSVYFLTDIYLLTSPSPNNTIRTKITALLTSIKSQYSLNNFKKQINTHKNNDHPLCKYFTKDHNRVLSFLDNELSHYSKPQGKSIAILLIALNKAGYMVDWNRKLSQILSAFRDRYGDKIGSQKNIEDYLRGYRNNIYSDKNIAPSEIQEIENKLNQAI